MRISPTTQNLNSADSYFPLAFRKSSTYSLPPKRRQRRSPKSHSRRRNRNDSVLKVFCSFLNELGADALRSGTNAFYRRSQGLERNIGKYHFASARTRRPCAADLVSGSHRFQRPCRWVLQLQLQSSGVSAQSAV